MDELSNFEDSLKKLTEQVNNFSVDTQKHTTVFGGLSLYTKSPLVLLAIPVGILCYLLIILPVVPIESVLWNILILTIVIFAILSGIALLILILGKYYIKGHVYLATNHRLIIFRQFIWNSYRDLLYEKITDTILSIGPFGRIFDYGDIVPITAGAEYGLMTRLLTITGVKNANDAKNTITSIKNKFSKESFIPYTSM